MDGNAVNQACCGIMRTVGAAHMLREQVDRTEGETTMNGMDGPIGPGVAASTEVDFRLPDKPGLSKPECPTQADFSLPIACSDLDYFRSANNSVLFVGATNLIPPVSTSSLAAGRHNRKNPLDR